eukprot:TRINITY_DN766_c0_g1_i1.p1 TRINITY_DN766_c0_g1~~TRINITY_DN766_c0_g1_i1.p1  ORF type:complete len:785 (+),score=288.59 TRINITY_DN766_c0_g1_i1:408-2762(+)
MAFFRVLVIASFGALCVAKTAQLCCNNARAPCHRDHQATTVLGLYVDHTRQVGSILLTQMRDVGWTDTQQPPKFSVVLQMDSCYVVSEVAIDASTWTKALPVDPSANELDVGSFAPQQRFAPLDSGRFEGTFSVSSSNSLAPSDGHCADAISLALHARVQCNCSRSVCGASARGRAGLAAFAYSSAPLSRAERNVPAVIGVCCSAAAPNDDNNNAGALADDSDADIADVHAALPTPPAVLVAAKLAEAKAGAIEVDSELQLHELHARQLDDQGTTGESAPPLSSSSSSSSGSSCQLPLPVVRLLSATSVELSVDATCRPTRRRSLDDGSNAKRGSDGYSIEQSTDGGQTATTVFETTEQQFVHVVDGLTAGQAYSFRVCHGGTCGGWVSVTPTAASGAAQAAGPDANASKALSMAPWLIGVIVAAAIIVIALIIVVAIIVRRRRSSSRKQPPAPVDAPPVTPEAVLPQISISSDSDDEDQSFYLDREGGLQEEKRQRTLNELLSEYESHRPRLLKRKGTSAESSASVFSTSWDSDDEEEWSRLSQAATRVQAAWRGYAVRHPRNSGAAAAAAHRLSVSAAMSGFDVLIEQLRAAKFGSSSDGGSCAQASAAMLELLGRIQRAAGVLYGADAADDDSLLMLLPEDIAAAINALSFAVNSLLAIGEGDKEGFEAAAANVLKQKAVLEALLAAAAQRSAQPAAGRTRSWSAFKSLLHEFRGKKAALEGTPDQDAAQLQLLEQFRMHAESLLVSGMHACVAVCVRVLCAVNCVLLVGAGGRTRLDARC